MSKILSDLHLQFDDIRAILSLFHATDITKMLPSLVYDIRMDMGAFLRNDGSVEASCTTDPSQDLLKCLCWRWIWAIKSRGAPNPSKRFSSSVYCLRDRQLLGER